MNEPVYVKNALAQLRADLLQKLVDLAAEGRKPSEAQGFRDRAQQFISELHALEKVQSNLSPPGQDIKYARFKRAVEAILAYLEETNEPATEERITAALVGGGFRGRSDGTETVVMRSINSYIYGTGKKNPRLKRIGDLIGRIEWEDSRFDAPKQ